VEAFGSNRFAVPQKIGEALMVPVAGILLGVGSSIGGAEGLEPWLIEIGEIMKAAGGAVFAIPPLIFAIGAFVVEKPMSSAPGFSGRAERALTTSARGS
jgi:glucose PTS system EIICB or EIICBA component